MKQELCMTCDKIIVPVLGERMETIAFKGEEFTFTAKYAHCPDCGEEFITQESQAYNLHAVQDEYRQRHEYLSPEEIRGIRNQYGLGAKSFAMVIGLGEISITRYENGAIPDEAQHNLILLSKNPNNFSILFDRNKGLLTMGEQNRVMETLKRATVMVVWQPWTSASAISGPVEYKVSDDYKNCLECISA